MEPNLSIKQINELAPLILDTYGRGSDQLASWRQATAKWSKFMEPVTFTQRSALMPFMMPTVDVNEVAEGVEVGFQSLVGKNVIISLKRWGGGVEIPKIDADYAPMKSQYLIQAQGLPQIFEFRLIRRMFQAWNTGDIDPYYTMYDGEQLFSENHKVGPDDKAWSNLLTGSGTTTADIAEDINRAYVNSAKIPWGPSGEFMNVDGANFTIVSGPELKVNINELVYNKQKPLPTFNTENQLTGSIGAKDYDNDIIYMPTNLFTIPNSFLMIMSLPGLPPPMIHARHATEGNREMRVDTAIGGLGDQKGMYRFWIDSWEEAFPNHFFFMQLIKNEEVS